MKMKKSTKKIYRVLLAAVMILSLSFSAFAYDAYISSGDVRVKTVTFTDAEGNALTSLTPGEMKVSTSIRANAAGKTATLIACAYQGAEMVAMEKTAVTLAAKKNTPVSLTLTVPTGADQVKAFVWDDLDGIYPYSQNAVFASGNVNVREILIDGVPLENFSNNTLQYTVPVNAGYLDYPEMIVRTEDASAKAEITTTDFAENAPVATIAVTNGTASKTFTLTYEKAAPAVTNAKVNVADIKALTGKEITEANAKVTTDILRKPVIDGSSVTNQTLMWNNRSDIYYKAFPDKLEGATVIQLTRNLGGQLDANYNYSSNNGLMDFEINRSAEIYVHIDNAANFSWLPAAGFADGGATVTRCWGTSDKDLTYWKKTVDVNPGETQKVSIGYFKGGDSEPTIIVKFLDKAPETEMIQNAKFYTGTGTLITDKTVKITKNVQPTDTTIKAYWPSWRTQTLVVPEVAAGADYLPMGNSWNDITGNESTSYYCTFELTKTATVYVGMWINGTEAEQREANPWLEGYTYIPSGFTVGTRNDTTTSTKDYGFQKTFEVNPGETVTVTVGPFRTPKRPSDPYTAPYVFVKPE